MLIIALPPQPQSAPLGYDHVLCEGLHVIRQDRAVASLLSHHAGEVVGVIPSACLSWMEIELPPVRQKHQLPKIIHALLEDKTLQDPAQLHLVWQADAPEIAKQGGKVLIAVCHKDWLRGVLQPLQQAGLTVQRLVPELTPSSTPVLHLIAADQTAQCWLTHPQGVTRLPNQTMSWPALGVALNELTTIKAEPALSATVEQHFSKPAQLITTAQRWMQAAQSPWDFAQGEWAQTGWSRWRRLLQHTAQLVLRDPAYRSTRLGVGAWVLVSLIGLNVLAWREQSAIEAQKAQLNQILTETFPSVTLVIDAPLQMQREMQTLAQSKGGLLYNDFEPLLTATMAALPASSTLSRVDYAGRELKLQGPTLDAAQMNMLRQKLSTQGLNAQNSAQGLSVNAGVTP